MAERSLWPTDFTPATEQTPADLLEAQAKQLEIATDGKLTGRIEVGSLGNDISLNFMIVAPALDDYQYRLFRVMHGVYPPYPAKIVLAMDDQRTADNRDAFQTHLSHILHAPATRNVIAELLSLIDKRGQVAKVKKRKSTT